MKNVLLLIGWLTIASINQKAITFQATEHISLCKNLELHLHANFKQDTKMIYALPETYTVRVQLKYFFN
jgi:hypothetical protein